MIRLLITFFAIISHLTKLSHFQITSSRWVVPPKNTLNSPSLTCVASATPAKEAIPSTTYRLGRRSLTGFFNSSTARKDNCSCARAALVWPTFDEALPSWGWVLANHVFYSSFQVRNETKRNETCGNLRRRGLALWLVVGWARTQQQQQQTVVQQ